MLFAAGRVAADHERPTGRGDHTAGVSTFTMMCASIRTYVSSVLPMQVLNWFHKATLCDQKSYKVCCRLYLSVNHKKTSVLFVRVHVRACVHVARWFLVVVMLTCCLFCVGVARLGGDELPHHIALQANQERNRHQNTRGLPFWFSFLLFPCIAFLRCCFVLATP